MKSVINTVKGIKAHLKNLSTLIKVAKQLRKLESNQKLSSYDEKIIQEARLYEVSTLKYHARHYHIAYCEFRGRTRSQIEIKTETPTNESYIATIKVAMEEAMKINMVESNA